MAGQTRKSNYELILEAAYQTSGALLYWHQIRHDKLTSMNKLLIGIASIFIPIIGTAVLSGKISSHNLAQVMLIEIILGVLITSIFFGFIQLVHEYAIFSYYNSKNSKRAEAFYDNLDKTWEETKAIADKFRIKDPVEWLFFPYSLVIQAILISTALFLSILLISSFL